MRITVLLMLTLALTFAGAQDKNAGVQKTKPVYTSPNSGIEMFQEYCAVCHGRAGKGDGPAASALKKAPADLTTLSARNGGKFPETRVYGYIEGSDEVGAHGNREMPIWGQAFRNMGRSDATIEHQRISNLTDYIKRFQK